MKVGQMNLTPRQDLKLSNQNTTYTYLDGTELTNADTGIFKITTTSDGTGSANLTGMPPFGTISLDSTSLDFSTYSINYPTTPKVILDQNGIKMEEGSDIKIGDFSLKESLNRIEERLNLLTTNQKLEAEWEELRKLGEQYRLLEKDIVNKMQVWDLLKRD